MPNKPTQHSIGGGFTLLELIVAIALMDVIAVSLYASMHIGFKAKTNTQAAMKPYQAVIPAFAFLRNDLNCAMTPNGLLAGIFLGEDAVGADQKDADVLSFYTDSYHPAPDEIASNIIYVEYRLEADSGRKDTSIQREDSAQDQLVLKRKTIKNLLTTQTVVPDEEIICRDITGFDVKYYDGYSWLDTWDSTTQDNTLPRGVQIMLEFSPLARRDLNITENRRQCFTRIYPLALTPLTADEQSL
ncbi:MAG: prepilin-type N-terminal cleavage/methylation domain-containing protein [Planctomycetales bacterium]|nr:prepilin-type N-terminal cleavage/methylation domain-containing protein [Planctomycetales bacterium]